MTKCSVLERCKLDRASIDFSTARFYIYKLSSYEIDRSKTQKLFDRALTLKGSPLISTSLDGETKSAGGEEDSGLPSRIGL
jgi:hypothetical protein